MPASNQTDSWSVKSYFDDYMPTLRHPARPNPRIAAAFRIKLSSNFGLGLAHLRVTQGRRDEGKQILASVYGSFTEGFDMADLKEAKRFLDTL